MAKNLIRRHFKTVQKPIFDSKKKHAADRQSEHSMNP